jgi:hypothetical protein
MNSKPLVSANLSQMTFKQNEKLIEPVKENMFSSKYNNMLTLSDVNSNFDTISDMSSIMPAYLSQARMSNYYQDNPFDVLSSGIKYGVTISGGNINPTQPSGSKPGNTYENYLKLSK